MRGLDQQVEARTPNDPDQSGVDRVVGVIEIGVVQAPGPEQEGREGEGRDPADIVPDVRLTPEPEPPPYESQAEAREKDEGLGKAGEKPVHEPGIPRQAERETDGPGSGGEASGERPKAREPQEQEHQGDEEERPPTSTSPKLDPGGFPHFNAQVVEPETEGPRARSVDAKADAEGGGPECAEVHRPFPEDSRGAEHIDGAVGQPHLGPRPLGQGSRGTGDQDRGAASEQNGQVHRGVARRPVRRHALVDLVIRQEPREVGSISGAEVETDRLGSPGPGEDRGAREGQEQHQPEGVRARLPRSARELTQVHPRLPGLRRRIYHARAARSTAGRSS